MLWVMSLHIFFMITWFSGLFYLPRLFVYHAMAEDQISRDRFSLMERKLFFGIMTPGGVLTTLFGIWLLSYNWSGYLQAGWMHLKLALVLLLWVYHIYCGKLWYDFKNERNHHSHVYYRVLNEIPTVVLLAVVILATVKPF